MINTKLVTKLIYIFSLSLILIACKSNSKEDQKRLENTENLPLKEAFKGRFLMGTALNSDQIEGKSPKELELVKKQFNSIVAENAMKSERLFVSQGVYDFSIADQFIDFGIKNDMVIHGHTLIWHSQLPEWFFKDSLGNQIDKKELKQRMKNHINTVVTRYKGKVKTWDVVNEAVLDNGELRKSQFYEILGEEYLELAYQFAHEADPEAELYYNDYSTALPMKREGIVKMIQNLKNKGVSIQGIGMQGHLGLNHPDIAEFEKSILAFSDLGVKVSITELDVTVLPSPKNMQGAEVSDNFEYNDDMNPYINGLPAEVDSAFTKRYLDFFKLFIKHQDKIDKVTLWGVNDGNSWRNDWPVAGRTDYALLFDRNNKAKPVVDSIIKLTRN